MPIFFVYDLVMGDGVLAVLEIHHTLYDGAGLPGQRRAYGALRRPYGAADKGEVFPADGRRAVVGIIGRFCRDHGGQDAGADIVLCDEGKAGGVPIKAVDAAEDKGNALLLKIPCESVCNCVVIVPHGRMDRHSGGLVDDHEVFILIDNIQRELHGRNLLGGGLFADAYREGIAVRQPVRHEGGLPVDQNILRFLL